MKTSRKIIISISIIIAILIVIMVMTGSIFKKEPTPVENNVVPVSEMTSPAVKFAWRYEKGTEDLDGLPKTIVFLDTTYENDKVVPIRIEEVQGSCNAIDPVSDDKDMVSGTTKIQCYAAGFGEFYKIIKGADAYQVVRKHIEEGNPDVAPIDFKYENVAQIPFFQ